MTARKITHYVIAQYAIGRYAAGQIISRHSSYDLARKAAKRVGDHFAAIREADPK